MRNYKRKSRWVNLDGYTDGSSNSLNNSNIIPTNQITMRNTSQPLYGQGIDQNGYPITDRVYMEPGNNYNFDGASAVFEEPVYQGGGYYIDMPFDNQVQGFNPQNYNTNYNDPFRQFNPRQFNFTEYEHPIPTYSAPATVETETVGGTDQSAGQITEGKTEQERFQFYNPYAGVDLGGASTMFGKSLAEGNTFGAIASGLKVGTGLARNVLSGVGIGKRNRFIEDEYRKNQREAMTGANRVTYLQDGGEMQGVSPVEQIVEMINQGASEQEVFEILLQNGLSEEEAMIMMEEASQYFRFGGMLKNRKIKKYNFNEKTGDYEVEFE